MPSEAIWDAIYPYTRALAGGRDGGEELHALTAAIDTEVRQATKQLLEENDELATELSQARLQLDEAEGLIHDLRYELECAVDGFDVLKRAVSPHVTKVLAEAGAFQKEKEPHQEV